MYPTIVSNRIWTSGTIVRGETSALRLSRRIEYFYFHKHKSIIKHIFVSLYEKVNTEFIRTFSRTRLRSIFSEGKPLPPPFPQSNSAEFIRKTFFCSSPCRACDPVWSIRNRRIYCRTFRAATISISGWIAGPVRAVSPFPCRDWIRICEINVRDYRSRYI